MDCWVGAVFDECGLDELESVESLVHDVDGCQELFDCWVFAFGVDHGDGAVLPGCCLCFEFGFEVFSAVFAAVGESFEWCEPVLEGAFFPEFGVAVPAGCVAAFFDGDEVRVVWFCPGHVMIVLLLSSPRHSSNLFDRIDHEHSTEGHLTWNSCIA